MVRKRIDANTAVVRRSDGTVWIEVSAGAEHAMRRLTEERETITDRVFVAWFEALADAGAES